MIRELNNESEVFDWVLLLKWNLIEVAVTTLFLLVVATKTNLSLSYDPILQERFEKSLLLSVFFAVTMFGMTIWVIKTFVNYFLFTYLFGDSLPINPIGSSFSALVRARRYPVTAKLLLTVAFFLFPVGDYVSIIQRKPLIAFIVSEQLCSTVGIIAIVLFLSEVIGYSYLSIGEKNLKAVRLEWTLIIFAEAVFLPV